MVKITKHLAKKFDLPVSLETVNVSRNLLGISGTAFSFLIETPSLLASLVFLFLPEAQEFLQVQQHLSNMTRGYPGGAWVLDDDTEPYHLWTAYCRLPSSRKSKPRVCLILFALAIWGLPGLTVCPLPLYVIVGLAGRCALPTYTQPMAYPTIPRRGPLGKESVYSCRRNPCFLQLLTKLILYF